MNVEIPIELLEQFKKDNIVLFIGEGINQNILPSSAWLTEKLAERCDYPPGEPQTLPRVAGYYEMKRGSNELILFLRERLDDLTHEPLHVHKLVAQLRPRVIVTTCYDRLLELALRESSIPYVPIVRNAEIAYADEGKVLLVWLWGMLDQPDSIIITEDKRRLFLESRVVLSNLLFSELIRRTWLFVGFDAEDEWFRGFYDSVSRGLEYQNRRAYILGTPGEYARLWWKKHNAEILDAGIETFLTELTKQIAREGLENEDFHVRAGAVTALGQLHAQFAEPLIELLVERLNDDYPQVRVAAIHALEKLWPSGQWREQLEYERYIPAGEFEVGDDDSDDNTDKPVHKVYIDAFYIGRYPLTNAEYKRYMDDIEQSFDFPEGKGNHPVTGISWQDASNYAEWAGMRLLTEAEWEKGASWDEKTGTKRKYPWGEQFNDKLCNTNESSIDDTTPVEKYSSEGGESPYGCADMTGNVWEWTSSLYGGYLCQAQASSDYSRGSSNRSSYVLRGGSFYTVQELTRTTYRRGNIPDNKGKNIGVRMGITTPPHPKP